jgi:alanine racemase
MIQLDDLLASIRDAATLGAVVARSFEGIAYDSRTLRPGDLFVAVRTERADGHDFIEEACRRGAAGVLTERPRDLSAHSVTSIVVPDTRTALIEWARFVLSRQRLDVIAIGGSIGKTSTQAALLRTLSAGEADDPSIFHNGNFNDRFGLPVALGSLSPSHVTALIELGSDRPGEMEELAELVRPRIAILTNVAPVHTQTLGSLEQIATEQQALVRGLPPDGWAVLNGDDERVRAMAEATPAQVLLYGYDPDLDLVATDVEAGPEGLNLTLVYRGQERRLHTRLLGFHNAYTLLAAAGAALVRGASLDLAVEWLRGLEPLPGRLRPLPGRDGTIVLDDTQSASPRSLAAALEALDIFPQRKLAVLGEISDLSAEQDEGDEALAAQIAGTVDLLVVRGARAAELGRAVAGWGLPEEQLIVTDSVRDSVTALASRLRPGDAILVKGSEEARMERVAEGLLDDPSQAANLLVRQDQGWKQRVSLPFERPTWIEVDLDAIANNVEHARALASPAEVMVVLKADAYGHGAIRVARTAFLHGASMGGVACLSEAVALREAGIRAPLLLLGYTPAWQAREIVRHGLSAAVSSRELALALSRAAQDAGAPPVPVHIKVDTGMSRLGLAPEGVPAFLSVLRGLPGLTIEGIFTHFATADAGADDAFARVQLERFRTLLEALRASGACFRYVHAANSAGLINGLGTEFNLVRIGVLTYGLDPSPRTPARAEFRAALSFKTRVAQVKSVPEGACVSYGCAFVASRASVIAVIPVGYGDGFRRSPCNWGEVLVRGRRAPIAGNVCMDMAMLDVTDIPGVKEGDEVVLIGRQGEEQITADDVARRLGTINYEVVTEILPRVPRMVP